MFYFCTCTGKLQEMHDGMGRCRPRELSMGGGGEGRVRALQGPGPAECGGAGRWNPVLQAVLGLPGAGPAFQGVGLRQAERGENLLVLVF